MKSTLIYTSALVASAYATVYEVTVGPGLSYTPDSISAAEGDVVSFNFGSGHNVVSGAFDSPCSPDGMVYSGEPQEGDVFSVTINGTDPMWIYCSVPEHCQGGMAMVINAPSDHTVDDYKSAAQSVSSSSAPDGVTGGTFGAVSSRNSSSSSSSAAASSGASMTSSGGSSATGAAASASSSSNPNSASTYKVGSAVAGLAAIVGCVALL